MKKYHIVQYAVAAFAVAAILLSVPSVSAAGLTSD